MSGRTKLVFCIDSPGFGGSEINLLKLVDILKDSFHISFVTNINPAPQVQVFINEKGIDQVSYIVANRLSRGFQGLFKSLQLLKKQHGDIYIFWCHHINSNRWLQLAAALLRLKFIVVEQLLPTIYSKPYVSFSARVFKRFIAGRAFKNVICAYSQENSYRLNFKTGNTMVIPNTRDVKKIAAKVAGLRNAAEPNETFTISCIGRLAIQKNQEILIEAFRNIKYSKPVKLLLVGDGENRKATEAYILEHEAKNVVITGFTNDVYPYLAKADLFVLPSLDEGLPGALIEAMAAKLPCIASNIPGNNELVVDGETGYIFEPTDAARLTELIDWLIENPAERERVASNGYNLVLGSYDQSVEIQKWEQLLNA